ncbi:MAG: MBL fold metallo-hydrolase [Bacteroidota bacterium]
MPLIQAFQKDQDLLADIHAARSDNSRFHLWWLGQSGYLLQWQGKHLLIDPYLSDSLTHKYAETDKPHVRMTELVIQPEALDFIDLLTSSHNHTDHLDGDTLIPLIKANPHMQMIFPEANRAFVNQRIQQTPDFGIGLNDGQTVEVAGFNVTGIPAAHNELERDEKGQCKFMGYVFQFGPWTVYHSGDTLWRQEILEALEPFDLDLLILPINGHKPERRVAGNLNAAEAVKLTKMTQAKMVIPCHYDMFTFNTVDPAEFEQLAMQVDIPYTILQSGERYSTQ